MRAPALLASLALLGVATAQAQPDEDRIRVRALGPHVSNEVIRYIAENAATFRATRAQVEANPKLSARDVIGNHCGWMTEAHFAVFQKKHPEVPLDEPLGERALDYEWPACLYVHSNKGGHKRRVRRGETASHVYRRMTGGGGNEAAMRHFFRMSAGVDIAKVQADASLIGAYVTQPVELILPQIDRDTFWSQLDKLASVPGPQNEMVVRVTEIDRGAIVVQTDDIDTCAPVEKSPFDAAAVVRAYQYVVEKRPVLSAKVIVIDNGFEGADPAKRGAEFAGSPFHKDFFASEPGAVVARRLQMPGAPEIFPINASNGIQPGLESGHGTHVTGLVLGGPAFREHWFKLRDSKLPWAEITTINVGLGQRSLIDNAYRLFNTELTGTGHIVNMSITYDANALMNVASTFDELFVSRAHLYVVAAGNDHAEVGANVYPAGAGGLRSMNVITVAALDNNGRFTRFSNRGAHTVDMAAPGCEVSSWLENDEKETLLSGTSQAAPLVTFTASLLRSFLDSLRYFKPRLIASGDLLHPFDQEFTAFRVMLNVPKALLWYDDYVKLRGRDAGEYIGTVNRMTGLRCERTGHAQKNETWSFKRGLDDKTWVYLGKPTSLLPPCAAQTDADAKILFKPKRRITGNGFEDMPETEVWIPLKEVVDLVYRMPGA